MVTLSVTPGGGLPAAQSRCMGEAPPDVETGVPGDALRRGKRWCPSGSRRIAASVLPSWKDLQSPVHRRPVAGALCDPRTRKNCYLM